MKKDLFIIDGSSYIFRAFFAIRPLSTSKGLPTNACLGFTKMILKLISTFKPEYATIAFDSKEKNFRHRLYPEYKANRDAPPHELVLQIPYIHKIADALNITSFKIAGYEADDIIGTLVSREKDNFNIIIVSGDKDLMQLVGKNVKMYDPMVDKTYDEKSVEEKLGVPPSLVSQWLAIVGDSSDNIPGVAQIGPKGATSLFKKFKDLDDIYANLNQLNDSVREKLLKSKENAFLSKKLTSLDLNVPFNYQKEDLALKNFYAPQIYSLFKELEFVSLLDSMKILPQSEKEPIEKKCTPANYKTILKNNELDDLIDKLNDARIFSIDTETTSIEPRKALLVGISFCLKENEGFYIPVGHNYLSAPTQLDINYVLDKLRPVLEDDSIKLIGQNLKYDLVVFKNYNINLSNIYFDTMVASYILNPEIESHSLDSLSKVFFNHEKIKYSSLTGKGKTSISFNEVDVDIAAKYSCEDVDFTFRLYNLFKNKLSEHPSKKVFYDIEMPLVKVLADMEFTGVFIDIPFLTKLSHEFQMEINDLQKEIHDISGEPFNINSTKQLSYILFQKLGIEPVSKTKTGLSTSYEVLEKLSAKHLIATKLLAYREITKLKNTYIDALPKLFFNKTQRIHTSYNQTITTTGRLSSSNPNLQNIPIRTKRGEKIRRAFTSSSENNVLVKADYNQIELRIMAHIANDHAFIDDFQNNRDIHKQTAMYVYNLTESTYTPEHRRNAKAINFGLIYGIGPFALAENLNISTKEAKELIDRYFKRYHGVKEYMEKTIQFVKKNAYVETLFGRKRTFSNVGDNNKIIQRNIERAAINSPIQGTSADIIKIAMIKISKILNAFNSKMILQVHDELVFETPLKHKDEFINIIKYEMENVIKLKVDLIVDVSSGKNWLETE